MNIIGGVIGGVVGGLIGAAIWAGVTYGTGYEIGWIAWGVGGLVGLGCALGGKGSGSLPGAIAVVITILAILGGKYAAVELSIGKELGSKTEAIDTAVAELENEEFVISYVADEIIEERTLDGQTIDWPTDVEPAEAEKQSHYPRDVWAEAASQWEQKSEQEKEAYRDEIADGIRQNFDTIYSLITQEGFASSFGLMDLLFFGLAVYTAYRIAANGSITGGAEGQES